jgi:serine/threonine protein kinase
MIDSSGTVKIIDFGSTCVAGILEIAPAERRNNLLGTAQYTAPEYFLGGNGTPRSDLFSLGVITYQMLTSKLPYGANVAKCKTKAAQGKLRYDDIRYDHPEIPAWVDDAIRKAVHPNPYKRQEEVAEFLFDLRHPNQAFMSKNRTPLLERNPLAFWKGLSLTLAMIVLVLLFLLSKQTTQLPTGSASSHIPSPKQSRSMPLKPSPGGIHD